MSHTKQSFRIWALVAMVMVPAARIPSDVHAQTRSDLPSFLFDTAYRSKLEYSRSAVHDGNQIAITFHNYGLLAGVGEVRGNWPKGSEDFYVGDVLPMVAAEIPYDADGDGVADTLIHRVVTVRGPRAGQNSPPGDPNTFWGFEPMGGFAAEAPNEKPAISTDPTSWPERWPDQPDWIDPATGGADWNGYFGRGIKNADLESYFWLDDHNDLETQIKYPGFSPDSTDETRGGLGLAMKVRGMQWSQFLAQDALFVLYEVYNTSTVTYPRVAVGLTVGTLSGGDGDSSDDLAFFDQANRIVYSWDYDGSGNQRQEVGYVGYGFMESPGDATNGIDDDGDGDPQTSLGRDIDGNPKVNPAVAGTDNTFIENDFFPRTLAVGDPIILIDADTYERSIEYVTATPREVVSQGNTYTVGPGTVLEETQITLEGQLDQIIVTEKNLLDEDLDGIVDEDVNLHFERRAQDLSGEVITLPSLRYRNWVGLAQAIQGREATREDSIQFGFLNPLIDEARDNGIDEDQDWDVITDDVGLDGVAGTADEGEGDGVPSPGEPNFDALDVDESDQIGLSSFFYFTPPGAIRMNDDDRLWRSMAPGFFTTNQELQAQQAGGGVDGDFIFSSGYFSMPPGSVQRFSLALLFGEDLEDITNNTITVQEIYNRNYNFARPPDRPSLNAVAGDGRVTLYWDNRSEASIDPVLGEDFEGYRIFRSTDPFFRDPEVVTDAFGTASTLTPLVQYDKKNGIEGIWPNIPSPDFGGAQDAADSLAIIRELQSQVEQSQSLLQRTRGTTFYLGADTGLRYSYVDTTVTNGQTYYYALTAYDRGSPEFFPAENNIAISVVEDGSVVTGANVVEVTPNAPAAGYFQGGLNDVASQIAGSGTGQVIAEVVDPTQLKQNAVYTMQMAGTPTTASTFTVSRLYNGLEETVISDGRVASPEASVFDGVRFRVINDITQLLADSTRWVDVPDSTVMPLFVGEANIATWRLSGRTLPFDYTIEVVDPIDGDSSLGGFKLGSRGPTSAALKTNLDIRNATLGTKAEFVYLDRTAGTAAFNEVGDIIILIETVGETKVATLGIRFAPPTNPDQLARFRFPELGDRFVVRTRKPFSERDAFRVETYASGINDEDARAQLDRVRVVPNPYVAGASWERDLPPTITSGRGERRIDFIHLPAGAKVQIFNVRGELVRTLYHDGGMDDGTVRWDLRTRENLEVAYGIYLYHVEVEGLGSTTGKLAIIK